MITKFFKPAGGSGAATPADDAVKPTKKRGKAGDAAAGTRAGAGGDDDEVAVVSVDAEATERGAVPEFVMLYDFHQYLACHDGVQAASGARERPQQPRQMRQSLCRSLFLVSSVGLLEIAPASHALCHVNRLIFRTS